MLFINKFITNGCLKNKQKGLQLIYSSHQTPSTDSRGDRIPFRVNRIACSTYVKMSWWSFMISSLIITLHGIADVLGIIGGGPVSLNGAYVRVEVYDWLCGGTLVAHDMVLTAAHCLFGEDQKPIPISDVLVVKGDFVFSSWRSTAKRFSCNRYVVHELYETYLHRNSNPYNLALIELEESVDLNKPENQILLPCPAGYSGRMFDNPHFGYAVGMGLSRWDSYFYSSVLRGIRLIHEPRCSIRHRHRYNLLHVLDIDTINHVCYYSNNLNGAMCMGDSGGPIVHKEENEAICLIGIDTFGDFSCDPSIPSVFIRAAAFSEWIFQTIRSLSSTLVFDAAIFNYSKPLTN